MNVKTKIENCTKLKFFHEKDDQANFWEEQ